jgi:hypothetical protein
MEVDAEEPDEKEQEPLQKKARVSPDKKMAAAGEREARVRERDTEARVQEEAGLRAAVLVAPVLAAAAAAKAAHVKAAAAAKAAEKKAAAAAASVEGRVSAVHQQLEREQKHQLKSDKRKDAESAHLREKVQGYKEAAAEQAAEAARQKDKAKAARADMAAVQKFINHPRGAMPKAMPEAFKENWEHKNALQKRADACAQGALEDEVRELQVEVACLEDGAVPIFIKDEKTGEYPTAAKLMVFEMLTHMASAEAIEKNLVSMHAHVYPSLVRGTDYHIPDARTIGDWRESSQFFTETIAAVRAAKAPLWKQLFHDGSSDRVGTKVFSTLLSIPEEAEEGDAELEADGEGEFETMLLRGVHVIAGGESSSELDDIRRTMLRMQEKLTFLRNELQRAYPAVPAGVLNQLAPLPDEISLLKLAGGSAMGDNAAGAKKVSELLAAAMEKDASEFYDGMDGRALWANMDEAERISKSTLYLFTCWNHIRNLMCNEAVKQEAAVMSRHISDEEMAAATKAFGRSDIGSASGVMRASFKEFAVLLDNYKKGHGNDFEWWLQHVWAKEDTDERRQEVADGVYLYPLMRLDHGGRFDTSLDGAIAALLNCDKWLPFLKYRVAKNKSEKNPVNALEEYLLVHYQSAPVQACLRARVALAVKVNGPLRALTNQTTGGKRRNPLEMAGPCGELWDFADKLSTDSSFLFAQDYVSPFSGAPEADDWLEKFKARKIEGFTTGGKKVMCDLWPRLQRLLHTEDQAPNNITFEVSQAHAAGILVSLNRNAGKFLPRREVDGTPTAGGEYCLANQTDQMRKNCRGMEATNDCAESTFALFDYICRRCNGMTIQAASGVTQMVFNRDLAREGKFAGARSRACKDTNSGRRRKHQARLGWFHKQDPRLKDAIFAMISRMGRYFRQQNKADQEEQAQRAAEQAEAVRLLGIKNTAARYVAGKAALKAVRVESVAALRAKLKDKSLFRKHEGKTVPVVGKTTALLKEQIKIYTEGIQTAGGVTFPPVAWSCKTNKAVGTIATLTQELESLITKTDGMELPTEPPLEVNVGRVLSLGAAVAGQAAGNAAEEEGFRAAVMVEVARQEAAAGAGALAPVPHERRPPVPMPMPPTPAWVARDIQVLFSGVWRNGTIRAVSEEGQVRQLRTRAPRAAAAAGGPDTRSDLVPAGRVQVDWEGSGGLAADDHWYFLRSGLQHPLCDQSSAQCQWRVLSLPLSTM